MRQRKIVRQPASNWLSFRLLRSLMASIQMSGFVRLEGVPQVGFQASVLVPVQ